MLCCGMYDFSGEWGCTVGLPAKSGVAGALSVVIPSVMGLSLFSPRLDARGNSVRGVEFCKAASAKYGWNIFDQLFMGLKHEDDIIADDDITDTNNADKNSETNNAETVKPNELLDKRKRTNEETNMAAPHNKKFKQNF